MRNRLFDSWFAYANSQEQYVIMVTIFVIWKE